MTQTKLSACRRGLASLCQLLGYDSYVAWDKRRESVKASVMYSVSLLSKAAQIIHDCLIYYENRNGVSPCRSVC